MAIRWVLSILAASASLLLTDANEPEAEDVDSINISLLPESESPLIVTDKDKPILRYGFHRTHDCQNFDKAFICVRKCLDLDYQIAHADKDCICTCYKNNVLAKYKAPHDTASTKWKLRAPTTYRPSWAGGIIEKKPNDYEINANYTEFIEEHKSIVEDAAKDAEADGIPHDEDIGEGEGSGDAGGATGDAEGITDDPAGTPDDPAGTPDDPAGTPAAETKPAPAPEE